MINKEGFNGQDFDQQENEPGVKRLEKKKLVNMLSNEIYIVDKQNERPKYFHKVLGVTRFPELAG